MPQQSLANRKRPLVEQQDARSDHIATNQASQPNNASALRKAGAGGSRGALAPAGPEEHAVPQPAASTASAGKPGEIAGSATAQPLQRHLKQQKGQHTFSTEANGATPAAAAAAAAAAIGRTAGHSSSQPVQQGSSGSSSKGPLAGICVYLHGSIPLLQRRIKIIRNRLQQLGAAVSTTSITNASSPSCLAGITHIVLHPSEDDATGAGSSGSSGGSSSRRRASAKQLSAAAAGAPASLQQLLLLAHSWRQQQHGQLQQQQQQGHISLVSDAWLEAVLAAGQYIPEQQYSLDHLMLPGQQDGGSSSSGEDSDGKVDPAAAAAAGRGQQGLVGSTALVNPRAVVGPRHMPDLDPCPDAPMGRFATWLGHWEPSLNSITSQVELVMHGTFNAAASAARGPNEAVRGALKQLSAFEDAVRVISRDATGQAPLSHEALVYAHAAAAVRGCAFPLIPALSPSQLQQLLPFVGAFTASIIHQLLTTGSCEQLEAFRSDQPVRNSRGQLRPDTGGGATRGRFVKLPGVGPAQAERWYKLGYRSYEALLAAAGDGVGSAAAAATGGDYEPASPDQGQPDSSGALSNPAAGLSSGSAAAAAVQVSREALYSLRYAKDLTEPIQPDEITEMEVTVRAALAAVTGVGLGWHMQKVGGGRRSSAVHDADFLISHGSPQLLEGLASKMYRHLVATGRLAAQEEGFCRLQQGQLVGYHSKARHDILRKRWGNNNRHQLDHYDHLWGIYITASNKRRRIDLMFIPPEQWVYALVGWTGSKQYLRFMRSHAGNCGMHLNSHLMMREVEVVPGAAAAAASIIKQQQQQKESKSQQWQQQQQDSAGPGSSSAGAGSSSGEGPLGSAAAAAAAAADAAALRQAVSYVAAAAVSGTSRVVLSVPNEVPPADRAGKDWWPQGWSPAGTAAGAGAGSAAGAGAGSAAGVGDAGGIAAAAGRDGGGGSSVANDRLLLSRLVVCGAGSDRPMVREADLFELLGIPYREPNERCA